MKEAARRPVRRNTLYFIVRYEIVPSQRPTVFKCRTFLFYSIASVAEAVHGQRLCIAPHLALYKFD